MLIPLNDHIHPQNPNVRNLFSRIVSELDQRLPGEFEFKFICQVQRDSQFLEELTNGITGRKASFINASEDIDQCMEAYDDCTHVVSNRLHALLFGTLRGCVPIALVDIDHNQKIIGIFNELNAESNLVMQDTNDPIEKVQSKLTEFKTILPDSAREKRRLDAIFVKIFA